MMGSSPRSTNLLTIAIALTGYSCGGAAAPAAPASGVVQIASAPTSAAGVPAPTTAKTIAMPSGLLGLVQARNPDALASMADTWAKKGGALKADMLKDLDTMPMIPRSDIALERPAMVLLHRGSKGSEQLLVGVSMKSLANIDNRISIRPGIAEVANYRTAGDADAKPAVPDHPVLAAQESEVCWFSNAAAPTLAFALCGKKQSVAEVFDYAANVAAIHDYTADVHVEVFANAIAATYGPAIARKLLPKDGASGGSDANRKQAVLGEILRFGGEIATVRADFTLGAAVGEVQLALAFSSSNSWLTQLALGAPEGAGPGATGSAPEQIYRMPADSSVIGYRLAGKPAAWMKLFDFAETNSSLASDVSPTTSANTKAQLARLVAAPTIFATGFDLKRVAAGGKFISEESSREEGAQIERKCTFAVAYTEMPTPAITQLMDALHESTTRQTKPGDLTVARGLSEMFLGHEFSDVPAVLSAAAHRSNLPAELRSAAIYQLSATVTNASARPPQPLTRTARSTFIVFPLGAGTVVVNAADESLALEKAQSVATNQATLAATPLGATLRTLRAPVALVVTPRSIIGAREYASNSPIKRARYATALQAPTAFAPILMGLMPNQPGQTNGEVRVVTTLPRDAMNAFLEFGAADDAADAAAKLSTKNPTPTARPNTKSSNP
jgi:hypothetical protein